MQGNTKHAGLLFVLGSTSSSPVLKIETLMLNLESLKTYGEETPVKTIIPKPRVTGAERLVMMEEIHTPPDGPWIVYSIYHLFPGQDETSCKEMLQKEFSKQV